MARLFIMLHSYYIQWNLGIKRRLCFSASGKNLEITYKPKLRQDLAFRSLGHEYSWDTPVTILYIKKKIFCLSGHIEGQYISITRPKHMITSFRLLELYSIRRVKVREADGPAGDNERRLNDLFVKGRGIINPLPTHFHLSSVNL